MHSCMPANQCLTINVFVPTMRCCQYACTSNRRDKMTDDSHLNKFIWYFKLSRVWMDWIYMLLWCRSIFARQLSCTRFPTAKDTTSLCKHGTNSTHQSYPLTCMYLVETLGEIITLWWSPIYKSYHLNPMPWGVTNNIFAWKIRSNALIACNIGI
jgi:hypothetical protein